MLNANEKARLEAIAESLDWRVHWGKDDVEFEKYSPEGEDFSFSVDCDTWEELISGVAAYSADFDVDEHVELWIDSRGKRGVPSSVRALVEDAEAIDKMVRELASKLNYPDLNKEPEEPCDEPGKKDLYKIVHREVLEDEFFYEATSQEEALAFYEQDVLEGRIDFSDAEMVDSSEWCTTIWKK